MGSGKLDENSILDSGSLSETVHWKVVFQSWRLMQLVGKVHHPGHHLSLSLTDHDMNCSLWPDCSSRKFPGCVHPWNVCFFYFEGIKFNC